MVIYIYGVSSGPSPAAGIGIARSLRAGFPHARLTAVDHDGQSPGLSWAEFDEALVFPNPAEVGQDELAGRVARAIESGGFWITAIDRQAWWLAETFAGSPRVLVPPRGALIEILKPAAGAAEKLGLPAPASLRIRDPAAVTAFCDEARWDVWVKGPIDHALRISNPEQLDIAAERIQAITGERGGLFVQRHVEGHGESIAFCALNGMLLGAAAVVKWAATADGKTWTAEVSEPTSGMRARLESFVSATGWTGGGEIEMIRDRAGRLWLMEINPRFPAWVHGATLAGINLPARLVAAASRTEPAPETASCRAFTRVVLEIPLKEVQRVDNGAASVMPHAP